MTTVGAQTICADVTLSSGEVAEGRARCDAITRDAGTVSVSARFASGHCDRAGAVGGCSVMGGAIWYLAGFTEDQARMNCSTQGGTFVSL